MRRARAVMVVAYSPDGLDTVNTYSIAPNGLGRKSGPAATPGGMDATTQAGRRRPAATFLTDSTMAARQRCYTGVQPDSPAPMPVRPLLLTLALAAHLAPAAAYVCPPVTRVGLSDLGYASYREDGRNRGTAVDLIEELSRRTGCRFQFEWYPRGRLFAEFSANRIDMVMSSVPDTARDQAGIWMPYGYTRFELVLRQQSGGGYASLSEFVERGAGRLNITRGVYYAPPVQRQLDRLQQAGRLEYVNDFDTVFRKIEAGRADGTLAPLVIQLWHSRRQRTNANMAHYEVAEAPRGMVGAYASRANVAPELRQAFSAAFRAMVADGTVQTVYARYLGAEVARFVFAGGTREILDNYDRGYDR